MHAGWEILYSHAGHRMEGFRIWARADDVICDPKTFPTGRPPCTTRLKVHLAHLESREQALGRVEGLLGLSISRPSSTSGVLGQTITLNPLAQGSQRRLVSPLGHNRSLNDNHFLLEEEGITTIVTTSPSGLEHESRVFGLGPWASLSEKVLRFHRERYQLGVGAFARALNPSLEPKGMNFGGNSFGNHEESGSCRTGEFGGYGAWAQILHQRAFGVNTEMSESVDGYFRWLLNIGRDEPLPSTIDPNPQEVGGRRYSPYHLH